MYVPDVVVLLVMKGMRLLDYFVQVIHQMNWSTETLDLIPNVDVAFQFENVPDGMDNDTEGQESMGAVDANVLRQQKLVVGLQQRNRFPNKLAVVTVDLKRLLMALMWEDYDQRQHEKAWR